MYQTILVPLDGSKRPEAVLEHVENLVERYQAGSFSSELWKGVISFPPPKR